MTQPNQPDRHDAATGRSIDRRSFLGLAAAVAATPAVARKLPLLGASGPLNTTRQVAAGEQAAKRLLAASSNLSDVLPAYVPNNLVKPSIPSVNGSPEGFLTFPTKLVHTVKGTPGNGGTYQTITPLWGAIPPATNQYYQAVNKALGANLVINPANGNTYANTLPPLFAGNKLPDWIQIATWMMGSLDFPQAVGAKFVDLTPYLAGDNVMKYPNLAAIPTSGWQAGIWNGRLYGLPVYPSYLNFTGTLFYRGDIMYKLGIKVDVKSAQDLVDLGKEVNDPKGKRWAFGEVLVYLEQPFGVPNSPGWLESNGKLLAQWETPQYLEMLLFERQIISMGLMNPEDVAQQSSSAKQRFWSGQTVIYGDGLGAWNYEDAISGLAANHSYVREAFAPFTASGTGTPQYLLQNGASYFGWLNKSLSKSQVEELLRIANYLAAPFGSYEYNLVNYGVEGVDYVNSSSGPKFTSTGNTNVATTYQFLVSPQGFTINPGFPEITRRVSAWYQNAGKYALKPLFYDLNAPLPPQLSAAAGPTDFNPSQPGSLIIEVTRGRASVADFKAAVKRWQGTGGNALRAFYEKLYEQYYK
jgi:putative aldouronate transport system substrate-binding protein